MDGAIKIGLVFAGRIFSAMRNDMEVLPVPHVML